MRSNAAKKTPFAPTLAYLCGLAMTSCGLISLVVFVLYEFMHIQEMGDNVAQVVFAGLGGIALVLLGFGTMVAGSPRIEDEGSVPLHQ